MLTYRAGDREAPRGHAFLFFRDADAPDVIWATYLVVPPIALDLGKYIPAAFAAQIPAQLAGQGPTAYPLPPMPEKIEGGLPWLERAAELRGDDVLDGGTIRVSDPWQVMHPISEVAREYAEACSGRLAAAERGLESPAPPAAEASLDVDNLLLQVMSDRDKVSRIARLTGTLRYAVEGGDTRQAGETVAEMERVGRHLGEKYRLAELIEVGQAADPRAGRLAQLYVERCYKLAEEDYAALANLDRQITALREEQSAEG